jgi:seryl-tRNA synthetase
MIDPKYIIQNPEEVRESARKRGMKFDVDHFIKLDENRRAIQTELDGIKAEKNKAGKEIAQLQGEEKAAAIAALSKHKEEEVRLAQKQKEIEMEWRHLLLTAPGRLSPDTAEGKEDTDNEELYTWGEVPTFSFPIKDHVELGKDLDIIDIPRGVKVGGARSYFLKNEGALLEMAVLQYTLHKLVSKGFTAFLPPLMVNHKAMEGTSYFPGGEEQAYALGVKRPDMENMESDDKYLIGTSEVPVASYHSDEMLTEDELPKRYAGYSYCFRREAGTYGKDTHGLYRIHQFQKVEQVIICKNSMEESARMHEIILKNAEEVLQDLKLPYRVVNVCGGDIGQGQWYKNDIETWMPSRESYGETHSCSTFLDFQSRRLNIRYKDKEGKIHFAHTLNNTCVASPRILIPLLEVYQNEDGTITIPEPLRPFMGGKDLIEAKD